LERWAEYFAVKGDDVSILSYGPKGRAIRNLRKFRIGFDKQRASLARLRLRWLLWRLSPDVVHVHWAHFAHDIGQIWHGPIVVTAWGSDIYHPEGISEEALEKLRAGVARADLITCDSDDLASAIASLCPQAAARISVIQWGVDTERFRRTERPNTLAERLGVDGRPVLLSPRNLLPLYNQETVLRSFSRVLREVPEAVLVLKRYGGDESYAAGLYDLIRELGFRESVRVVEMIPYESMPELYSMATVSVSVPFSDATPMSLLEAMACGSVPVCSDLPSVREWLTDGDNGYLVPATSEEQIADRVIRLFQNPGIAQQIAEKNRQLVEARASQSLHMSIMSDQYIRLSEGAGSDGTRKRQAGGRS
jgi:glycosyltransferase involved in cell wall biosynthesis